MTDFALWSRIRTYIAETNADWFCVIAGHTMHQTQPFSLIIITVVFTTEQSWGYYCPAGYVPQSTVLDPNNYYALHSGCPFLSKSVAFSIICSLDHFITDVTINLGIMNCIRNGTLQQCEYASSIDVGCGLSTKPDSDYYWTLFRGNAPSAYSPYAAWWSFKAPVLEKQQIQFAILSVTSWGALGDSKLWGSSQDIQKMYCPSGVVGLQFFWMTAPLENPSVIQSCPYCDTTCAPCSKGTYTSASGSTECIACPGIIAPPNIGWYFCSQCQLGTFANSSGGSVCTSCSTGTYATQQPASVCLACAPGTYTNALGSSSCSYCGVGTTTSSSGASTCVACTVGPANSHYIDQCTWLCNMGYYNATSTTCAPCSDSSSCNAGYYRPLCTDGISNTQQCSGVCVAGNDQFGNVVWLGPSSTNTANGCSWSCPKGRYKDIGTLTCRCCAVNYMQPNQTLIDRQCNAYYPQNITCPVGKYPQGACFSQWNVSSFSFPPICATCNSLSNGTYISQGLPNNASSCNFTCNAGYFVNSSSRQCQQYLAQCNLGYAWSAGTSTTDAVCTPCAQPNAQFFTVNFCDPFVCNVGYEQVSGACQGCQVGKYRNSLTLATCVQCPSGTYASNPTTVECTRAPVNGWSSASGADFVCNAGYVRFIDPFSLPQCVQCAQGQYAATVCTACPAGTYNPQAMPISACTNCTPGTYTYDLGSTSCGLCSPGYYSSGTGAKPACNGCSLGTFGNTSGASACTACGNGTYARYSGQTQCTSWDLSCAAGYYWTAGTAIANATCTKCAFPATSAYRYVQNTCIFTCISGYQAGVSGCEACGAGTFKSGETNVSCAQCAAGSYQASSAMSACTLCASGTFSTQLGATSVGSSCAKCPRGMYALMQGATACAACSVGTYAAAYGGSVCLNCAAGSTSGRGATYCYPIGSSTAFYNLQAAPTCQMVTDLQYAACNAAI